MMWMSRIRLRPEASRQPKYWQMFANEYGSHKAIWKLFPRPAGAPRDFLYRVDQNSGADLCIWTLSPDEPADDQGLFVVESKHYEPGFSVGDRLIFRVRVNPTVKRSAHGARQGKRHDVIMDAKFQGRQRAEKPVTNDAVIQREGAAWLLERTTAHGFSADAKDLRCSGYKQLHTGKGRGDSAARISVLDVDGLLSVTNPEVFVRDTLFKGLGPAKGFGCGLMLVRRA